MIYMLLPGSAIAFYGDELGLKDRVEALPSGVKVCSFPFLQKTTNSVSK